jgi:hypothetical protein
MTDDITDTLREVRAARVRAMSNDEKVAFLKAHGWVRDRGNMWRSRDGITSAIANAVRLQLMADFDEGEAS